ncbi:MAG: response regulator [Xanthomonadales bacterium]|nr:response regulator [Xanthomonadales bacterium]ODU94450.1 MAG: DNA-binding response regulator [Rhodanobacter sp. SCN 66-43]OJY87058.1 MAG: DNA-binding response regulator [Xanthomonadales bacterium 66-474]
MRNPTHLLVVDDDIGILDLLRRYFAGQGFEVSTASNGAEMRSVLGRTGIDLVLLDLGLPGEDGFELTRQLRKSWNGALIIITGRGDSVDRVVGLELGADDYVTKPFELRELLARIRSVLRRSASSSAEASDGAAFHFAGFSLDPASRTLRSDNGDSIALTTGEYELLHILVGHPNRVLSRDELMEHIHGRSAGPFDRAIDVQIARLRRKIESDPANPELIKSVRGAGYLFAARVQTER